MPLFLLQGILIDRKCVHSEYVKVLFRGDKLKLKLGIKNVLTS